MNIIIYYLTKKIIIQTKNQNTEHQLINDLDLLKKEELKTKFKEFINHPEQAILTFETTEIKNGLEKFSELFKVIYAAGGLIKQEDKYLFIYRLKKWDLPKGKIDKGESPEQAAIRECEEECAITGLSITKELEPTYHIYEYKGDYALKKTFWYAMNSTHKGHLIPQTEENIERVEWFDKNDIEEVVIINSYPAILDVLKNID